MIPTVNYQVFVDAELELLDNRDVYFLPDLGDANQGSIKGMTKLAEQVDSIAKNIRLVNLISFLEAEKIIPTTDKLDLSEVISHWTYGSKAFISALKDYCNKDIYFNEELF